MANVFATPETETDNPFADFAAPTVPRVERAEENPFADFATPAPPVAEAVPSVDDNPFADFAAPVVAPAAPVIDDNPFAEFAARPNAARAITEPQTLFEEFTSGFSRQMAAPGTVSGFDLIGLKIGSMDAVKWSQEQAAMQRQAALAPASKASESRLSPYWWAARAGELIPQLGEIGLWTAAGIPASPIGGPLATASTSGALLDMSNSFLERLRSKHGVDTTNETALYLATTNPAVFEDAFWYSAKRAGAIGIVSALTGGVAGKVLPGVLPAATAGASRTLAQKTGVAAVGAGIGTVGGGVEETAAQLASTGGIEDFWDVVDEALIGSIASLPEVVAPSIARGAKIAAGARAPRAPPGEPVVEEPPMEYTVDADGNVALTDQRLDPNEGTTDVRNASELVRRVINNSRLAGGTARTPLNWVGGVNIDPERGPAERRVYNWLFQQHQTDPNAKVPLHRLMQEMAPGLLETNWERWRARGEMPVDPVGRSMLAPLTIAPSYIGAAVGIREVAAGGYDSPGVTGSVRVDNYSFRITADNNEIGDLNISTRSDKPGDVHVDWIIADGGRNPGKILGMRGTINLLNAIKQRFPAGTTISGLRVSGARAKWGATGHAEMPFEGEPDVGREVSYPLPDNIRVVTQAEGRDINGRRTLVVHADQSLNPAEVKKVIDHAQAEGYDAIAFAPDSTLGGSIAAELDTTAETTTVNMLFGGPETLGAVPLERLPESQVELATETAAEAGEPYAPGRFDADQVHDFMARIDRLVQYLQKAFHFTQKIKIELVDYLPEGTYARAVYTFGETEAKIQIKVAGARTLPKLFTSVAHEFGHLVMYDRLYKADTRTQLAILREYAEFQEGVRAKVEAGVPHRRIAIDKLPAADIHRIYGSQYRGNFIYGQEAIDDYWGSFTEWFASQVSRWMTTQPRPMTLVDRFFNGLAKTLRRILERFYRSAGLKFDPPVAVKTYLDAFLKDINPGAFKTLYDQIETETRLANAAALHAMGAEYVQPVGQTAETGPSRDIIRRLFGPENNKLVDPTTGAVTFRVDQNALYRRGKKKTVLEQMHGMAAISDKIARFGTGAIGIYQLAQRNLHIPGLQRFVGGLQEAFAFSRAIMNRAVGTTKLAEKLNTDQMERLHNALDDYVQMRYRSPREIRRSVKRMPTQDELTAIWDSHELSEAARRVFMTQIADYNYALDLIDQQGRDEIARSFSTLDPNSRLLAQAKALQEWDAEMAQLRKQPYIPQMRWGIHTVTVWDKEGNRIWFSQDETVRQQAETVRLLRELYPDDDTHTIVPGELADDVVPMLGLPRPLLKLLKDKAGFSKTQIAYIEDLAYELAPVHSFKHRMQTKQNIAGYSKDFSRAYANYFLALANYLAKAKWGDQLAADVKEVQEQGRYMPDDMTNWGAKFGLYDPRGSKRTRIGNEMADHLRDWMDPKADFWWIKGVSFFIALGYNPLSAFVNLTGILTGGYSILAEGFGDIAALKHIGGASSRFARNRTKIDAAPTDDQMIMRQILVMDGTIDESFAANLAAIAEGRNMLEQVSNKKVNRGFYWMMEKSSLLFQYTEKTVRIVVADAAYKAALEQPTAKFVRDSIQGELPMFERLVREGINPTQAAAIVTAKRAVNNSQGIYAQWARPRLFRGKRGTFLQFKAFQQNLLWNMWNHKQGAVRTLLVFGLLGGMMAEPGAEDISDILKFLARTIFGKDFDLERDARDMMVTWAKTDPGLFLHGTASKGFGIPALLDIAGKVMGLGSIPFPEVDLSSRISVGQVSPIPLSIMLSPTDNPDEAIGRAAERAGGAAFGLGFVLFRALTDTKNQDHWLRLIPAAIRNVPKAWEAMQTGELRDPYGGAVIKFDTRDTEQMMEVLAYALGANPARLTKEWQADRETREVLQFWDLRQQSLLRQLAEAVKSDDPEERESVISAIKEFNQSLPTEIKSKRISATTARESVQARLRREEMRERNIPYRRQDRPVAKRIRELYFPEAEEVQTLP